MSRRDDIDFEHSRAILVGTSEYTAGFADRRPMPAALNSLRVMREALTGPCEWPSERVTEFPNQQDGGSLLRTISTLIGDVTDVLLFYYVGHGQPIPGNGRYDLGLALTDTSEEPDQRALSSLRFRDLREQMERSKARIKILILDCCCSGIATKYAEPAANATAHGERATPLRGAGTYIWAACGHSAETYFEESADGLAYFTKFLTDAIRDVSEEQSSGVTVAELHAEVKQRLRQARIPHAYAAPVPDLHYTGRPDQFLFVHGQEPAQQGDEFRFEQLTADDPRRAGSYEFKARLGAGGIGRVFLAFTPAGWPIAVKLLKPEFGQDPEFAKRFSREIDIARQIRGSHVAQLFDADPQASRPWLASTYVCGPTLLELVRAAGPLPTRDILLITLGIAQALRDIHASGAVHRDLKPANVMLDESGPKVIDFGIAKSVAATFITRTNMQLGTPTYRSPEQATGRREVTSASDVFTLGATIYFLATGKDAFEAEDPLGVINLIAHEQPDLDVLDEQIRGLVEKCLAKDPDARPAATELVEICAAAVGPVSPGAYLRIAGAAAAIQARAGALRAITAGQSPTNQAAPKPPEDEPPTPPTIEAPPPPAKPPAPARDKRRAQGVLAVVALIVALAVVLPAVLTSRNNSANGPVQTTSTTDPNAFSQGIGPTNDLTSDPTTTTSDTTSPTSTTAASQAPQVGDCLANNGTFDQPDMQPADCGNGVFQIERILPGTIDRTGCAGTPDDDYNVADQADDLVYCLSLQRPSGYHAQPGDCVFGPRNSGPWTLQGCHAGDFTVRVRLSGTTDTTRCYAYASSSETTFTTAWSQLDVVLCLTMNYPDAAGNASVGSCLLRTGSGPQTNFQAVPCGQANVVVTGRVAQYDDLAYCGANGWTTWESAEFPGFDYTVCFRGI